MTARLLLRKRFRKLTADSKGFSSVIGTTFMVLVMMFLGTSVFLWTLSQNTLYNEAVRTGNQEEADRRNEGVVTLGGNYSVSGDNVTVLVVLKNAGSVTAQIINLWVLDTNQSRYANMLLNLNLNPGDVEPGMFTVTMPGANANNTFVSWFVTARGNTVPLERELEEGVIVADIARGIGSMALEFEKFRYFTYNDPDELSNYPDGVLGFDVSRGDYVAFGCYLTNLDPSKQTIILDSHSLFWQPGRSGVAEKGWFIANVDDDGTINGTYSTITVLYQETIMLIFASQNDLGLGSFKRESTPNVKTTVATFLLLHGNIGPRAYAQNIPFVSLYYY